MDYEKKGAAILQSIWFAMVQRIVEDVIKEVGANDDQAQLIRDIYLIPGNYHVILRDDDNN